MKKLIFIKIVFNTFRFSDIRLDPEWIKYRMNIFMNYTCQSLINQTNQSFMCTLLYDKLSKEIIESELRKYPELPKNIVFESNLNKLKDMVKSYDYVYEVRLDDDDMYHNSFTQQLLDYSPNPETQVLINQKGYVYDIINDKLGKWYFEYPPFYTLIYKASDYLNNVRYYLEGGHAGAIKLKYEVLESENYMVILHGKNTLNKFNSRNQVGVIEDLYEKNRILNEFKVSCFDKRAYKNI
ncbi:glycosyltransferase [Romboutsia sp. 1001713B170207_170306_H8]|uniref:glycosyltransferase n=1 Tax=Romboutsia sp. 1001713B170207_170306_H8 TaxID=2787112 RepID=UPI00082141E0|nr:glycosyltransferase [Romboutsia sp. 1001713B170207_170306_H8]SCI26764.1 Protein of uncharacterised function (DUF3118) [uncultured Clostridium sp.]